MQVLENPFDTLWWDEFLETTKQMTKPSVFQNCLTPTETSLMRSHILDILSQLAALRTNKFGYRVYVDGTQLTPDAMQEIYDLPPLKEETLEQWVVRVFGERKFGMIINQGERFNMELSRMIALKLEPYLAKTGIPTEGMIYTLFIGNYDSTPLGIHKDLPGKSVMHFHLGPGSKTMYTWDDEVFKHDLLKSYKKKPLEQYTPYANKHCFHEGDIYFMPENIYHIGTQEGLSIGIACWSFNRANIDFAKRLLSLITENYLQSSDIMLKPDKNDLENSDGLRKTLELYKLPRDFSGLSFNDALKQVYKDLRYSLHSNAGYRTSPFPRKSDHQFTVEDLIQLEKPYQIKYAESRDGLMLNLYVRGVKIEVKNFPCIKSFVDQINKGAVVKASALLELLDPTWPEQNGLYLLNLIYLHHGIKLVFEE